MTIPLFDAMPRYCPDCGRALNPPKGGGEWVNLLRQFDGGNICNCSACQFEYAKTPSEPKLLDCGCLARYGYTDDNANERCMNCDLANHKVGVAALEALVEKRDDEIADLRAEVRRLARGAGESESDKSVLEVNLDKLHMHELALLFAALEKTDPKQASEVMTRASKSAGWNRALDVVMQVRRFRGDLETPF